MLKDLRKVKGKNKREIFIGFESPLYCFFFICFANIDIMQISL